MNDQTMLNAIMEISKVLSEPSIFDVIAMVISGLSLITTVIVIVLNYRALKAAKDSVEVAEKSLELTKIEIQKAIDVQLYDRRLAVANRIEKNDYSDSVMEIALLYGTQIYMDIKTIKDLISEKNLYNRKHARYDELLDVCEDADEYRQLEADLNNESIYSSTQYYEKCYKRYEELSEKYAVLYDYTTGEEIVYDIEEICKEELRLDEEIRKLQKQLKNNILHIMRQKLSLEEKLQ